MYYILEVYGGEYDDRFEYHYYSNDLEKLKEKGVNELVLDLDASGFVIREVVLEDSNIVAELDTKVVYRSSYIEKDEINFRRLEMILKQEKEEDFTFECEGRYYHNERPYNVEIKRISKNKISILKVDAEEDEVLDFDEYIVTNCRGMFVEQVIYDYDMYCEYREYED